MSEYNVGLNPLLLQPEFYGDVVYKFRKKIGKSDFPYHLKKIIVCYKTIGNNIEDNIKNLLLQNELIADLENDYIALSTQILPSLFK